MAIIPITFAQLVQRISDRKMLSSVIEHFRVADFDVDSWKAGGGYHTVARALSSGLSVLSEVVQMVAAGGYLDHARGPWLTLLARSWFGLRRRAATYAVQTVRLTLDAGASPEPIVAGTVWVTTESGLRFNLTSGGTVPSGGSLTFSAKAEHPGSEYNVSAGTITRLVTPRPGLTATNTGLTTAGLAEERDTELRARCRARWGTLAAHSPSSTYAFWALTDDNGIDARAGVTRCYVDDSNPEGAGTVNVYLADEAGPADPVVVVPEVDTALQSKRGISTVLRTLGAVPKTINPVGTAWVRGTTATEAQAAGSLALNTLLAETPIGGHAIGGERGLFNDQIAAALREVPGVVRVSLSSAEHLLSIGEVPVAPAGDWPGLSFKIT